MSGIEVLHAAVAEIGAMEWLWKEFGIAAFPMIAVVALWAKLNTLEKQVAEILAAYIEIVKESGGTLAENKVVMADVKSALTLVLQAVRGGRSDGSD